MTHHDGGMRVMTAEREVRQKSGLSRRHSTKLHQDTSCSVGIRHRVVPTFSISKLRQWDTLDTLLFIYQATSRQTTTTQKFSVHHRGNDLVSPANKICSGNLNIFDVYRNVNRCDNCRIRTDWMLIIILLHLRQVQHVSGITMPIIIEPCIAVINEEQEQTRC